MAAVNCTFRVLSRSMRLMPLIKQSQTVRLNGGALAGASRLYGTSEANTSETSKETLPQTELEKKLQTENETLSVEITSLNEKNGELLDKYRRSLADGENLRKRLTKQIEDAKLFGIQSFCKDLLDVADILSRATEAVPKDEITDRNPHLKNLYDGLVMTKSSLGQVFKRHGLETVNPINEKFNPNLHEALFQKEVKDVEAGVVVEVTKIGYKLHERCIRPALVGVSRN